MARTWCRAEKKRVNSFPINPPAPVMAIFIFSDTYLCFANTTSPMKNFSPCPILSGSLFRVSWWRRLREVLMLHQRAMIKVWIALSIAISVIVYHITEYRFLAHGTFMAVLGAGVILIRL